ncbi:hypothetical protein G4177_17930 [Corallococcus sp. ZKHCc1 1396]|uniref:Uncharacterized protein n=1 Tax=Corallococcus soli TaxID=2710757 RepID=A0ABR9PQ37_9BACT|nr:MULTISPECIES: hypothetical protein [Corallococcus]MBE4750048.1 hypothetical protein [Corallococcus soli]MCY1035833.1 hypothetical protein [Corallococcus sp. BB11-1]RYZ44095.1 MAG: hypothetical protein EOO72_06565 [Myxococcaceae bacterium]
MGGIGKALGKVMDIVKPFVTMVNPLLGAAMGFASGLMQGKNPIQSLLGAATDLIPGGGVFKNALSTFANSGLMDGAGGNSLLSGALNLASGKSKVTDVIGDLFKANKKNPLTELGTSNAAELAAQRMSTLVA